jgi:hypothetical protein
MADGDLNIRINTSTDPKGLQEAKKQLDEVKQTAEKVAPAIDKTNKEFQETGSKAPQAIERTRRGVKGLLDEVKAAPGFVGKLNAAFSALLLHPVILAFATLATAVRGARKAITEFAETERDVRSWGNAAAAQGRLTESFRNQVSGLVDKMEKLTAIDGAHWWAAIEEVTKRGATSGNIERYVEGIANLTALMGTDGSVEAAAKTFGQAMSGQMMAIRRLGIEVDDTKTLAEQLDDILQQLAERGAGVLEGRSKTLTGQMDLLKIQFNETAEAVGGFLARTRLLQASMAWSTWVFTKLQGLLPEIKIGIDDIANKSPKAAKALKDVGDSAAAGADGIDSQKTALESLSDAYEKAKKAAEEFRAHQDALDDEEAANQLAQIDYLEEAGIMNENDASKARAGVRRATAKKKTNRELSAIAEEEARLRADSASAVNRQVDTEERAKSLGGRRDELLTRASRFFGVSADELRDPKKLESLILSERARLGKGTERDRMAARNGVFAEIEKLPHVMGEASRAENAAAAAKANYEQVFAATSPRIEAMERRRHLLGFTQSRIETENRTELLRIQKNAQGGSPTDFRNAAFAPAAGNLGGEMQENTRLQENNGNKTLHIIRDQNALLKQISAELDKLRIEQNLIKSREKHRRNP